MSELKPCPFCGGEARIFHFSSAIRDEVWRAVCNKPFCAQGPDGYTEAEAIDAWNTRVWRTCFADEVTHRDCKYSVNRGWRERTCKFVSSKGSDYPPVCSACGYELGIYDCAWYEDGTYGYERNYCPNCGAKVVDA